MKMHTSIALAASCALIAMNAVTAETQVEDPDPMAQVRGLIDAQVMKPLKASPTRMYSRVMLMPASYELQAMLNSTLVPFRVRTPSGTSLLGLANSSEGTVHLLDTTRMQYVPAAKHPGIAGIKLPSTEG